MTTRKEFSYKDEEIRDKNGKRYYLRTKHSRKSTFRICTIRTQRNGKGKRLGSVRFIVDGNKSIDDAMVRLCKKWRQFYFVVLYPAWIPEQTEEPNAKL